MRVICAAPWHAWPEIFDRAPDSGSRTPDPGSLDAVLSAAAKTPASPIVTALHLMIDLVAEPDEVAIGSDLLGVSRQVQYRLLLLLREERSSSEAVEESLEVGSSRSGCTTTAARTAPRAGRPQRRAAAPVSPRVTCDFAARGRCGRSPERSASSASS